MPSFYKRGKTWSFSMDIGYDKDGKRKKKGVGGFRTKKEAEVAAAQLQVELTQGVYVQEKDITFQAFTKDWLEKYSQQVKKSTVRVRQHEIDKLKDYFNLIKIKDITKKQYQDALFDLQKKGFAENTISGIHGAARMIFKSAVDLDIIKNDPTQYARPPRKQETLEVIEKSDEIPKYLEKNELLTFLQIAHDAGLEDDYAIFLVLAYTGIRVGELCALKWSDIDFEERQIKITKTYYNPNNNIKNYELQTPKTKSSRRIIDITERVTKELELHRAKQSKTKQK